MADKPSVLRMEEDALSAERRAHTMGRKPVESNASLVPPGLSGPCEEAAALYAVGKSKEASHILTTELNKEKGRCPAPLWYMLLDIYQATAQQQAFEKLALFFAKVFNTSPPSWEEQAAVSTGFGRNVLIVEGAPKDIHVEKVRDFLQAAKALRQARVDLSRAKLDGSPEDRLVSVQRLLDILLRLRRDKVSVLLMGETQIMTDLRSRQRGVESNSDPLWLLLFELLQWRGLEETFEDLAVEYAQRFDRCAPGYETGGAIAIAPEDAPPEDEGKWTERGPTLVPPPSISGAESQLLLSRIEAMLARHGNVRVDASGLRLLDYEAASALGGFLGVAGQSRDNIVISRPSELVKVLLKIVGAEPFVSIEPRRR